MLLKKVNELSSMCDVDVYVVIHHHTRYYTYKSTEHCHGSGSDSGSYCRKKYKVRYLDVGDS